MLELEVPGQPVPQPRPRVSRKGFAYTPGKHAIWHYRQAIELLARATGKRIAGPVCLDVEAIFERPASHWGAHALKRTAPMWPRADGDNVIKGVADALTSAGVWVDDSQVVEWRIRKRFAARSESAKTVIRVTPGLA